MSELTILLPDLQVAFFKRLEELRKTLLLDALLQAVSTADISQIDSELSAIVAKKSLQKLAGWGMRGELLFAVPYVLEKNPRLLGYYRLLLGFSQKQFYGLDHGFAPFKTMEEKGLMSQHSRDNLEELCKSLCGSADFLVGSIENLTERGLHELTLLTLGPQLRGGVLNVYGAQAVAIVFALIKSIVGDNIMSHDSQSIRVRNAAGRVVEIEFASDPDIRIREQLPSNRYRNLVAIEIKGGADRSNIHNRLGEAEKSHQKARKQGFVECWTIIKVSGLDESVARKESPSTDRFYDLNNLTRSKSDELADFIEHLRSILGISDSR